MEELFTRYDPAALEERGRAPACAVDHPDAGGPCAEPAVGEGWGCLPFCEGHWQEASLAAREELTDAVVADLRALALAEEERAVRNEAVLDALRDLPGVVGTVFGGLGWEREDTARYEEALAAAFPADELEGNTDPETQRYDYGRYDGDGPVEWWADSRRCVLRFMRQASAEDVPALLADLERLREKATAQLVLAERAYGRRWASLPREKRLAIARAHHEEWGRDV